MSAAAAKKKPAKRPAHVYMRVRPDGSLVCADTFSQSEMRRRKIKRGDLIRLAVSKPRNYTQWKKAHALGVLIATNIDEFERFMGEAGKADAHGALKHLQRLSGIECEEYETEVPAVGKLTIRMPASLSYDEMDETRFQAAYTGFCAYIVKRWWHDLDEAQIEQMASLVGLGSG